MNEIVVVLWIRKCLGLNSNFLHKDVALTWGTLSKRNTRAQDTQIPCWKLQCWSMVPLSSKRGLGWCIQIAYLQGRQHKRTFLWRTPVGRVKGVPVHLYYWSFSPYHSSTLCWRQVARICWAILASSVPWANTWKCPDWRYLVTAWPSLSWAAGKYTTSGTGTHPNISFVYIYRIEGQGLINLVQLTFGEWTRLPREDRPCLQHPPSDSDGYMHK